jgi:hypothetical protein
MILNFIVDKVIPGICYKSIDIYINMGNRKKILINFDDTMNIDKDCIIMAVTNNMLYHYDYNSITLDDFIHIINDSISRKSYNNDINSVAFYLTNHGVNIEYAKLFTNLYTNKITVDDFCSMLKTFNLSANNFNKLLKQGIKDGDIDDIKNNIMTQKNITKFLNYPRKSEWAEAPLVKEFYNIFTKNYFEFIKNYMENNSIELKYIMKALYHYKNFNSFHKLAKISILEYLSKVKTELKLHPTIPVLIYSKGDKISKNRLLENIYGHENIYQDLLNSNDFNNTIYLDLKYRIDRTDSKEYILNYRLLNDGELRQLLL